MIDLSQCVCLLDLVRENPKLDEWQLRRLFQREAPRTFSEIVARHETKPLRWGEMLKLVIPPGDSLRATRSALGLLHSHHLVEIHFRSTRSPRKLYTVTAAGQKFLRDATNAAG